MVNEQLQKKIEQSIRLLQSVQKRYDGEIELAYSGGKSCSLQKKLVSDTGRYTRIPLSTHRALSPT